MLSPAERARLLEANFGPSMDILDLEDAAKTLVRPALMLGPTYGAKTVGVWEGTVDGWPRERHDSRLVLCAHHGAEPWLEVVLTADGRFEAELLFHD